VKPKPPYFSFLRLATGDWTALADVPLATIAASSLLTALIEPIELILARRRSPLD
jgi:hypothetical protein